MRVCYPISGMDRLPAMNYESSTMNSRLYQKITGLSIRQSVFNITLVKFEYSFTMKINVAILILFVPFVTACQPKINVTLKKQLDSIMIKDQLYRDTLTLLMDPLKCDSMAKKLSLSKAQANGHYWAKQNRLDSLNLVFIEGLIKKYGYPGKTLVDTPANETAWYVIQHSPKIQQYIDVIKKAAESNELPFRLYAMMLDRNLMYNNQEQVYGTQVSCGTLKNGKNECFVWPIKDASAVNERRKKAGFAQTVEQNAQRLNVKYRVVKTDEIKQ